MIYFVQRTNGDIKIGITNNLNKRLVGLTTQHGAVSVLGTMEGGRSEEYNLHKKFSMYWIENEWFEESEVIIDYIADNCKRTENDLVLCNHLLDLMAQKQSKDGRVITAQVIAREVGIPINEVYRMIEQRAFFYRAWVLKAICTYFNCSLGDLLYIKRKQDAA